MGLPFLNGKAKTRERVIAIDLGGRATKAVYLQRRGEGFSLVNFAILEAPIYEKTLSPELLGEHLKSVTRALDAGRTRQVTLSVGVTDAVFRQVEIPFMPLADMRLMLKFNSKNYLQQDLSDHVFDCCFAPGGPSSQAAEGSKPSGDSKKHKVIVTAARKQLLGELETAAKAAGLVADQVVPGLIGPANAFELAEPEIFAKEVVALVDIGFKNTSITILDSGELILNRVVGIGGDHITSGLAETMGVGYTEAENIKVGMPSEVQQSLESLLNPLGRELRASIDFFENQRDKTVSQIFISGGSARSEHIIQALHIELMVACKS